MYKPPRISRIQVDFLGVPHGSKSTWNKLRIEIINGVNWLHSERNGKIGILARWYWTFRDDKNDYRIWPQHELREFSPFLLGNVLFCWCSSKCLSIFSSIPLSLRPFFGCVVEIYLFNLLCVGFLPDWKNLSDKPLSLSASSNHQTEVFCKGFWQALATSNSGRHLPLHLGSNWIKLPRLLNAFQSLIDFWCISVGFSRNCFTDFKLFWQVFKKPAIVSKLRDLLRDHKVS